MPYHHLNRTEREVLYRFKVQKQSVGTIALALGRHPSTIYRELRRNRPCARSPRYNPGAAHAGYLRRIRWRRTRPKRDNLATMRQVERQIVERWSPEQIAGRRRGVLYPAQPQRWISHSTIYRHVREIQRAGGSLHTFLRRYGNLRPKRYGSGPDGRGHIAGRVLIDERPKIVDTQGRLGDWEGDTLHGPDRKAHVATFVDRKSLYLVAATMPDRKTPSLLRAAKRCFKTVPHALRHTLTLDNGPEFRQFKAIEDALQLEVYFAHPYASWERAINENTNGLLRQYITKKRPLHEVSPGELREAVDALNHRPRKKLGYRTPHEVFRLQYVALDL